MAFGRAVPPPPRFRFADRIDAGARLAEALRAYAQRGDVSVLGLPRGGVVVAARVAERLLAPLDVVVVRKVRAPRHPELAMGAVALWHGCPEVVREERVITQAGVSDEEFQRDVSRELDEANRRASCWQRGARPDLRSRSVIVVDDGLATGSTMRAALQVLRAAGAGRLVAAVPVAPPEQVRAIAEHADEVVCVLQPQPMRAVAVHYVDFAEVPDAVVDRELLRAAESRR